MSYLTLTKALGLTTVLSGCLLANSFIKPVPKETPKTTEPLVVEKPAKKTPLNDSKTLAVLFTLGIIGTGACAKKAFKK